MAQPSVRLVSTSTHIPARNVEPPATFEFPDVIERTDRVRFLLNQNLPHGVRQFIATKLGLRRESISRQLDPQRTERLSEDVAILGQLWLEQTGKLEAAEELKRLRFAGLSTVVLMLPRDRETWTFTVNTKTGEVR